jgi:hypothetical protein
MRKCPLSDFRVECGLDCEWYVMDTHTDQKGCVLVALARDLAVSLAVIKNLPQKVRP